MSQTDTPIDQNAWTPTEIAPQVPESVVIRTGVFAGIRAELVRNLSKHRALVRLPQGILLEIDLGVLKRS